jgi:hypothetical protein
MWNEQYIWPGLHFVGAILLPSVTSVWEVTVLAAFPRLVSQGYSPTVQAPLEQNLSK